MKWIRDSVGKMYLKDWVAGDHDDGWWTLEAGSGCVILGWGRRLGGRRETGQWKVKGGQMMKGKKPMFSVSAQP